MSRQKGLQETQYQHPSWFLPPSTCKQISNWLRTLLTPAFSEGNDGDWSTFSIRLGDDESAQTTRAMLSTAGPQIIAVLSAICNGSTSIAICAASRGGTFNISKASTWNDQGGFNLGLFEANLGYGDVIAELGLDTVGLGLSSALGPSLKDQVVAGIIDERYWYGQLGLSVQPTNFSTFSSPQPSFFQSLYSQKLIPSLSWAYTAGAKYRNKGVFGSLVFGGYDASRFTPNSLSFTFASDVTRDLVVGLQSIVSTDSAGTVTTLMGEGILAFIDSTLPYIWLPESSCTTFEETYGLTWDDESELYLLNASTHNNLLKLNPNIVFKLGNTLSGGPVVSITLPYSAFDLNATSPLVNGSSYYFPLKRAANETQYTLGRTFLQEAYLIADYDRQNFSISQNTWDTEAKEHIVTIHPPSANDTSNSTTPLTPASSHHHPISGGAIAGIAIAGLLALAILALLIFGIHRRRKGLSFFKRLPFLPELPSSSEKPNPAKSAELYSKDNLHSTPELEQTDPRLAKDVKHEMPSPPLPLYRSQQGSVTSASNLSWRSEVPGGPVPVGLMQGVYELGTEDGFGRAELQAGESGVPRIEVISPK